MSYRLHFASDGLPFEAGRRRGWSTVTTGSWAMSTSSLDRLFSSRSIVAKDDGQHTLSLRKVDRDGATIERHPLDGTRYPSREAATQAAYEAGALAFFESLGDPTPGRVAR